MSDRRLNVKDVAYISMLAALCVLATFIKIPFGSGAMVHLGSATVFTAGILFGGVYAGWGAAIGSAFYDLLMGFSPYTFWSFFIKGIAGYLVGMIAMGAYPDYEGASRAGIFRVTLACFIGAMWTLLGYVVAWWSVIGSLSVALANIPASLLTSAVGFIVTMLIYKRLRIYVETKFG